MNSPSDSAAQRRRGRHLELPSGVTDLLPQAAERFFGLRRTLLDTMTRWGYRPVVPPLIEHAEVFGRAIDDAEEVSFFKLVDRSSGHVLSLRPDFTPQIARIAADRFGDAALPLRFCYEGPVVRHVQAQKGRKRELHQTGAELLGVQDPEADAECIAMVIDCLRQAGLEGFKVDVGQVEFFKGIFDGLDLDTATLDAVTDAVARKDTSELDALLAGADIPQGRKTLLSRLPLLAGGVEVLDRAEALVETDHSRSALDNLRSVVAFVQTHGLANYLTIDLGELRGVDYHTGVIFEAFVQHLGIPLCRGGRYDGLVGGYGDELPATGFSVDVLAVSEALALQPGSPAPGRAGVFIINFLPNRDEALSLARRLRAEGVRACRDLVRRPVEESLELAGEQQFAWAAILGESDCPEAALRLVNLVSGEDETVEREAVPAHISDRD